MQHRPQLAHPRPQGDPSPNPESGIVLLMVVFLTFLMLLALAIAAPEWAKSFQRQKDLETIHRGQQYERAIQLYYRQFHRYPNTVKELLHTNNVRFLRKQYKDPLTGKDDWKLVLYGHAHVHPLGPFGKPLSDLGAVQASGGMYAVSGSSSAGGSAPTAAASASDSMGFGSSMSSSFGSSMSSGISSSIGGSATGSPLGSSSTTPTGTTTGSSASGSSSLGSPTSSSGGFQTNAPFVGVVPPIKGKSIVDYRAQGNYDRWEFNYDPIVDELRDKVSILGGTQGDLNGATSLNGADSSKKSSNSNSLFGGNNLFGGSNSNSGTSSNSGSTSNSGNSSSSGSNSSSGSSNNSDSGTPQ